MGAIIGVRWAARSPDRVRGIVCVDGAMPYGLTGEEGRDQLGAGIAPTLEQLACPARYVLGTGDSLGSSSGETELVRKALDPVLARKPNIKVSAKVASNHSKIMKQDFRAIADAVRELRAAQNEESPRA